MKVGLVIYGSIDSLSGGYLYDRTLVNFLRARGDDVNVISLPDRSYPGRLAQNLISSFPKNLDLDLLLQDELCHPSLISWNRKIKRSSRIPVISIVHHLLISEPGHSAMMAALYRRVEMAYLRSVDGFIFNSETTRQVVEVAIGRSDCAVVAHPGADRLGPEINGEEITARAHAIGPLKIMFLGNVIPRKGLDVLLEALSRLSHLNWRLTVVGSLEMDRSYANSAREAAEGGPNKGRIQFRGPLVDDRLAVEMREHHLMALPSHYEGYGIAYLEAMGF
ncbi:MAG TPA: glycosyltransferase family 4 protein, partial [Anaerolineales bacterium]|nr:glycosyltransferase family 4 protein [Anaerolineales bacterium]